MKNSIPIVFIHNGSGENYLNCAIKQAYDANNKVVLIGDLQNNHCEFASHYLIKDYSFYSEEFKKVYVPLSTHGDYETFCFQRWFILYEWMKKHQIEKCFYLDSDVLFYANAEEEAKKWKEFDFTLAHRCVGHASYFTYEGLKDFCKFTYETYLKKEFDFDRIAAHYYVMQKHGRTGGVCDMTYLEYYARYKNPWGVGETLHIIDNSTYDHCINQSDNHFEMYNGAKNIHFIDKKPYCKQLTTGRDIQFICLHFQGSYKGLIPLFHAKTQ